LQLIDSTASLWLKGEMEGKPVGVFNSTASTHGGQEITLVRMMIPLLHLGMLIVEVHYSVEGMLHTKARGEHSTAPQQLRRRGRIAAKIRGPRHCSGVEPSSGRNHSNSTRLTSAQVVNGRKSH
jgi:multimeric flavodoxin WrbA